MGFMGVTTYTDEIAKNVQIYALCCPDTGKTMYVGKSVNAEKRFKQHLSEKRHPKSPLYIWIEFLRKQNKSPTLKTISMVSNKDWQREEIKQISLHSGLLNLSKGGNQPKCDKNIRAMNGKKNAYKIHSNSLNKRIWYLKQQIGYAIKGGYLSETSKQKLKDGAKRNPSILGQYASL